MAISIADLPYNIDALQPYISEETLRIHYGKHHKGYVKKLNKGISGTQFEDMGLLEIVRSADSDVFNNAAQVWNHSFYWNCLTPDSEDPSGRLADAIDDQFGSLDEFKQSFNGAAKSNFGSGWTWLVATSDDELKIVNTSNADTPAMNTDTRTLLTCDVWEHAYYVDYRNQRGKYLSNFWQILNWNFVADNFSVG